MRRCGCDGACYECLRGYENRWQHHLLDRRLAADMLDWARQGTKPTLDDVAWTSCIRGLAQAAGATEVGADASGDAARLRVRVSETRTVAVRMRPSVLGSADDGDDLFVTPFEVARRPIAVVGRILGRGAQ